MNYENMFLILKIFLSISMVIFAFVNARYFMKCRVKIDKDLPEDRERLKKMVFVTCFYIIIYLGIAIMYLNSSKLWLPSILVVMKALTAKS